jgi:uncharacterized membrane protein YczE
MRTRVVRCAAASVLVALGISVLISAHLGVAPFDVLNTGLADRIGIPVGVAFAVDSALCFLVGALLGGRVGWASLVGMAGIAPLIQAFLVVMPEPDNVAARAVMFLAGMLVLVAGVSLVISTDLGPGSLEVVMLGLVARGIRIEWARWLTDGVILGTGIALGGAVGVGTVVFAVGFAPLVAAGLRLLGYEPQVLVDEPDGGLLPGFAD